MASSKRLKAMGVQAWFARLRLKGAASSPSFSIENADNIVDAETQSAPPKEGLVNPISQPHAKPRPAASLVEPLKQVSTEKQAEGSVKAAKSTVDMPLKQSVSVYRGDECTVLCGSSGIEHAPYVTGLTEAISSAFYQRQTSLAETASFVWPVFGAKLLESGSGHLHENAFKRFLDKLKLNESTSILVLGLDISPEDFVILLGKDIPARIVHTTISPADCLRDPSQKAVLWRELVEARRG